MFTKIFVAVLLAASAAAAPASTASHSAGVLHPEPLQLHTGPSADVTYLNYSLWAGGVMWDYPASSFKSVAGTFIVPTPSMPAGGDPDTEYSAFVWVGIDGTNGCSGSLLQTGLQLNIKGSTVSYSAWYEWFPASAIYFPSSSITFDAEDSVTLSVTATSNTTGTATIKNNSKNQQVTHTLSTTHALCGMHAEWIVEDFVENGAPVPLVDWGTVTFTNAYATAPNGTTYGQTKQPWATYGGTSTTSRTPLRSAPTLSRSVTSDESI